MFNWLQIFNTNPQATTRPPGTAYYYPFAEGLDCDQGFAALAGDPARESKIQPMYPTDATYVFVACGVDLPDYPYFVGRNASTAGTGLLLTYAYQPGRTRIVATGSTPALSAGATLVTLAAGTYTRQNLIPIDNPATYGGIHNPVPNGTYTLTFEALDGTVYHSEAITVTGSGPNAGYAGGVLQAQGLNGPWLFDVAGVTKYGFRLYDALNSNTPPGDTASTVYYIERLNASETLSQAVARVRANAGTVKYTQSQVSNVRASAITSLAQSTYRPASLYGIGFRGSNEDREARFAFNNLGGASAIQWIFTNLDGTVVADSGQANTPNYQATDAEFKLDPSVYQSSARVNGSGPLTGGIVPGVTYLLGLKITNNGTTDTYVHRFTLPANPNDQITQLNLSPLQDSNPSDVFVDHQVATKKRIGVMMVAANATSAGTSIYEDQQIITHTAGLGCNYIQITLDWNRAEPTTFGVYDWRLYDDLFTRAKAAGLKILPRISMSRSENFNNESGGGKFITDAERVIDHLGRPITGGGAYMGSYNSDTFLAKIDTFATAAINHFKAQPFADSILGFNLVTNIQQEGCYPWKNYVSGSTVRALYDYGPDSVSKFRSRVAAKYGTIAALNSVYGTSHTNFSQVALPLPDFYGGDDSDFYGYNTTKQKDAYDHKQRSVAELANRFHALVKSISTRLCTGVEYGSMHDSLTTARGTVALGSLVNTDLIKTNPQADYPIRMDVALSKRDYAPQRSAGVEIDASIYTATSAGIAAMNQFFAAGGNLGCWAQFYVPGTEGNADKLQQTKDKLTALINGVKASTNFTTAVDNHFDAQMTVTASTLLGSWSESGAIGTFNTLEEGGSKRVKVTITQNL